LAQRHNLNRPSGWIMTDSADFAFMQRALALAQAQTGRTAPNPSVGCVLVADGGVIAQAATGDGGRPHAEEQALAAAGAHARGATAYVTLEPCNQRSAGGLSCTDLLIAAGVARVVFASADPHKLAAGAGVARLRAAGIAVEAGLLGAQADALNADFFARVAAGQA
jgi:pyrimidine deaminase RibD-like protein